MMQKQGGNRMRKKSVALTMAFAVAVGTIAGSTFAYAEEATDTMAPFEDTVELHVVGTEFAAARYPEGDDLTYNIWTRACKDRFNVDVITDWISDDYTTKINLSIAEGDLPDVFTVNESQLQQLIDADLIWDLSDVFDTYASEKLKHYEEVDERSFNAGKRDGKRYAIPTLHYGFIEQPDYVWIRNDWKEELGLEDPKTMDDLVNIAKAFMEKYGGYGIAADQTLDYLNLLAPGWGAHPDVWLKNDDGEIVYGTVQPEMKDAVAAWADWYQEGILSPDFATMDMAKMNESVVAGEVGIQPFMQWWGYEPGPSVVANNGLESMFLPYNIPSATGETVLQSILNSTSSYIVVSKDFEYPEAALKLMNFYVYMNTESSGKEDPDVIDSFLNDGIAHVAGPFSVTNPEEDYEQFVKVNEALKTGDTSNLVTPGQILKYDSIKEYEAGREDYIGYYLQMGFDDSAYGIGKRILDSGEYVESYLWGITPETLLNAGSTLDDILTEGFTKIIIGSEPIDYFDTVVENWEKAGGEQATAEMNELYKD